MNARYKRSELTENPVNWSEKEVLEFIQGTSEYENDGFAITWLRTAKETLLANLPHAKICIQILWWNSLVWPETFEPFLKKWPLAGLMQNAHNSFPTFESYRLLQIEETKRMIERKELELKGHNPKTKSGKNLIEWDQNSICQYKKDLAKMMELL